MTASEWIGYGAAVLAGMVIGLAGGGGSIMTVPIFVYLFDIAPLLATTYSLFVVSVTSLVGSVSHLLSKRVDLRVAAAFAVPSFVSVYLTRRFLVPAIPNPLFVYGSFELPKEKAILYFFAIVMLLAARAMIRHQQPEQGEAADGRPRYVNLSLDGLAVGLLTGTIGAGGGFLIVPMLVLLAGMPMLRAVATSVIIIAVNSLIGFLGDLHHTRMDWSLLLPFTGLSVLGIFLGLVLSRFISPAKLKNAFGWFVGVVAVYMLIKEF